MVTLIATLACPRALLAQVDATAAARALFAQGVEAANAEDWSTAEDRFSRALTLRWAPPIAFNLAQAQLRNGRYVAATENLQAVLRSEETAPALREAAEPLLAEAEGQLGRLVVRVRGDRRDVVVRVGEQEIPEAMWDVAIPVDPGPQRVVGLRDGEEIARAEVRVERQGRAEIALELPEAPPSSEEAARALLEAERQQRARADDARRQRAEEQRAEEQRAEQGAADRARRRRRRVIAWTVVGVVVAAAAGTTLALTLGRGPSPTEGDFEPGQIPGSVF